jgi:hypothetical protein
VIARVPIDRASDVAPELLDCRRREVLRARAGTGRQAGRDGRETTGWSIRKFVRTARRYRTIQIQAGAHTITADPLPDDLRQALDRIHHGRLRTNLS